MVTSINNYSGRFFRHGLLAWSLLHKTRPEMRPPRCSISSGFHFLRNLFNTAGYDVLGVVRHNYYTWIKTTRQNRKLVIRFKAGLQISRGHLLKCSLLLSQLRVTGLTRVYSIVHNYSLLYIIVIGWVQGIYGIMRPRGPEAVAPPSATRALLRAWGSHNLIVTVGRGL